LTIKLELPEIETIRRDLDREISGRKVKAAEAASMTVLGRYHNRKAFTGRLVGRKLGDVKRVGLHLLVGLDGEDLLVIHLGAGSLLRRHTGRDAVAPGTELTITFTQGGQVRLIDPDGTSEVCIVAAEDLLTEFPDLADLGVDPFGEPVSWALFAGQVLGREMELKQLLCDDSIVVGIGDVYSDEVLFHAGLLYDRMSNTLTTQEVRRLYRSLVETVHDAVKYRGTSIEDRPFVDVFGVPGDFGDHLAVYGLAGKLSPRSRAPIQRIKIRGRWVYYCNTQV
jgi:formamidopyrimidine-DNA glycosylase